MQEAFVRPIVQIHSACTADRAGMALRRRFIVPEPFQTGKRLCRVLVHRSVARTTCFELSSNYRRLCLCSCINASSPQHGFLSRSPISRFLSRASQLYSHLLWLKVFLTVPSCRSDSTDTSRRADYKSPCCTRLGAFSRSCSL